MKKHLKKFIAPIIITIIVIFYYIVFFSIIITQINGIERYILCVIPLLLSLVMLKVCLERLKEIKGGDEDDISKY